MAAEVCGIVKVVVRRVGDVYVKRWFVCQAFRGD